MAKKLKKPAYILLNFLTAVGMVVLFSFPQGISVTLAAGGTITGKAVLPDGTTPAGSGLTVILNPDSSTPRISNALATTTTKADGSFTFNNAPTGNVYIFVMANSDTAYANSTGKAVTVTEGSSYDVGNIALTNLQVKGTITLADGTTPVEDVRVEVHTPAGDVYIADYTDSNGKYSIGGLTEGGTYSWEVRLDSGQYPGYSRPASRDITITSSAQTINASLNLAPKTISGKVTKPDGTPVNQAAIQACPEKGNLSCDGTHTDSNGNYTLNLPSANWLLDLNPDLGDATADWVYFGFPERVEFTLDNSSESVTKNFTVTLADAHLTGYVKLSNGKYTINSDIHCLNAEGKGTTRKTDNSGKFNFAIPAGSYKCSVFSLDLSTDIFPEKKVTVKSNETKDLGTFQGYQRTAHIKGKAYLTDGSGVGGVDIVAWQKDGVGKEMSVTNPDGSFDLSVIPGTWVVGVENGHSYYFYDDLKEVKITQVNQTVSGVDIHVARNETWIQGQLKDSAGNNITDAGGSVYLRDDNGHKYTGDIESDGTYSFAVPSEIISGDFNNLYGSKVYLGALLSPNTGYTFKNEIKTTLKRDMTVDIVLDKDQETISGRLKDTSGKSIKPAGDIQVIATDDFGNLKSTEVASDGTYSLNVADGDWNISYQVDYDNSGYLDKPFKSKSVSVKAGKTASQDLTLIPTDATIRGILKDENGNPEAHTKVFATNYKSDKENTVEVVGETDDQGVFELNVVSGTTYQVGAGSKPEDPDIISPTLQEVTPSANSSSKVNLQFRKPNTQVQGKVTLDGAIVDSGTVQAYSDKGGFAKADIGSDGSYRLNLTKDDNWHIQAAEVNGSNLYMSRSVSKTPTSTSESLNLDLTKTDFKVPPPEVKVFDADKAQAIALNDGTTLNVPKGAFADSGEITLTVSPTIDLAKQKQSKSFPVGYELEVKDDSNKTIRSFRQPVTLSFQYSDNDLKKLGVKEQQIDSDYWDDINQVLTPTGFAVSNPKTNNLTVYTDHFTAFALASPYLKLGKGAEPEHDLILTPKSNGGPNVRVVDEQGKQVVSLMVYDKNLRGEFKAVGADIDGDGTDEIVTGTGEGFGPQIRAFEVDKTLLGQFFAYDERFRGGINLDKGDIDGDGKEEIVVSPMTGGGPNIRVYSYDNSGNKFQLVDWFWAYQPTYRGGVNLALGDVNGDGKDEIVVSPRRAGGPNLRVYQYNSSSGKFELLDWTFAYQENFKGGVNIALGDLNGDGEDEIMTAPASAGGPNVRAYQYNSQTDSLELIDWKFVYQEDFRGGVNITAGDMTGDGKDEVAVGPAENGGPNIRVYSLENDKLSLVDWMMVYDEKFRGGVNILIKELTGDGKAELVTVPKKGTPNVRVYQVDNGLSLNSWFWGFAETFRGGVNLSAGAF